MTQLDRPRRLLAIALAALAGFVDATGFLAAGGYFTSFMSGNTTRLGVDLASDLREAAIPVSLIGGFLAGVVTGALVAEFAGRWRKTAVLALCAALLLTAALFDGASLAGFLGASVVAMGALNNVFRRNGEVAIGVTYMTGALVRFGQGLAARLLRRPDEGRLSAIGLWLGLALGALAGAWTFTHLRGAASWLALGLCVALLLAAHAIERCADQPRS